MTGEAQGIVNAAGMAPVDSLLRASLPNSGAFAFYDRDGRAAWRSAGSADAEIDGSVARLAACADGGIVRAELPSGRLVLAAPVADGTSAVFGWLAAVFDGAAAAAPEDGSADVLAAAAAWLGAHLRLGRELEDARTRADEAGQVLKLVYQVDRKLHAESQGQASLGELVAQSGRFLRIAYAALLVPAKGVRISSTHSSWQRIDRRVLDKYLISALMPRMKGRHSPAVFEIPVLPGSGVGNGGCQAMVTPLIGKGGEIEGVLAQVGRINGKPFRRSHQRFMAHMVRKIEFVIEQSFDAMTGLTNRSGFEAQLEESIKSLRSDTDVHQIVYLDLDNLLLVNDTFGEEAGDEVVKRFAKILEERIPANAVAGRLTGDDFAVLLKDATQQQALDLAGVVRDESNRLRYLKGDRSLQVTVSVGIASLDSRGDYAAALTAARIACRSAKDHGRDRVEVYDQDDQSIVRRFDDMHLVSAIQRMLDSGGFELLAQPIAALGGAAKAPRRFEILLRMRDAEGKRVSTRSFFSAAERYQMMPQIDRWVIATAFAAIARRAGSPDVSFAINLSGQSLGDGEMLGFIHSQLDATGLAPGSLCFEVTESAAVSNHAKAQTFIDTLRRRGCRFSLDDFGAGLSSFAYLKTFDVDILKIDGNFIKDITTNRISESMVAAIVQVARVMRLQTVAEYVETDEIREFVARIGVDYAQGHAVGKPAPLEAVLDSLDRGP